MIKLITFYEGKTIDELNTILVRIKGTFGTSGIGIIGNTYFIWSLTSAADCISKGNLWRTAQDKAIETNAKNDHLLADAARLAFCEALQGIAQQANTQKGGNEVALVSTGMTMALPGDEVGEMAQAVIKSIDPVPGIAGRGKMTIVKSLKYCHGTNIQTKNLLTGEIISSHSTDKHIIIMDGFLHNVDYEVRVCYDGTDKTLVWSEWFPFQGK
jgi:hypothetical protein